MESRLISFSTNPLYERIAHILREENGKTRVYYIFPYWNINSVVPSYTTKYGTSYFLCACEFGDVRVAQILLQLGVNALDVNKIGMTALMAAGWSHPSRRMEMTTWLLQTVPDIYTTIDALNFSNNTALMDATRSSDIELVRILLYHGADPTICDNEGFMACDFIDPYERASIQIGRLFDHADEMEKIDWRPWNAHQFPSPFQSALRSLLILAKAPSV